MNRTRGFVNLNRFKSGRAIKRLLKIADDKQRIRVEGRGQRAEGEGVRNKPEGGKS